MKLSYIEMVQSKFDLIQNLDQDQPMEEIVEEQIIDLMFFLNTLLTSNKARDYSELAKIFLIFDRYLNPQIVCELKQTHLTGDQIAELESTKREIKFRDFEI